MAAASISYRRPRAAKQPRTTTTSNRSVWLVLLFLSCSGSVASALNHDHRHDGTESERDTGTDFTQRQHQVDPRDMQVIVDGFVDSDRCWNVLNDSDADNDGRVDSDEYVEFAQQLEPGVIDGVEDFDDLPLAYVASFTATACLCSNPMAGGDSGADGCCEGENAHIRVTVPPSQSPNSTEINYLYTACSLTTGAAEIVQNSPPPLNPPTDMPVVDPTDAPTESPTEASTESPTDEPTESPVADPEPTLSPGPTPTPSTEQPTEQRERVISYITYDIALENGIEEINDSLWTAEYLSNLIAALNMLSVKVAEEGQQQSLRVRRSLAATIIRPTGFETVNDIPCPTDKVISFDDNTLCQEVTAKVRLAVSSEEDKIQFDTDLQQAIATGELQEELDSLMWEIAVENPVTVLTSLEGADEDGAREVASSTSMSPGAISGITIAALFFALVPIGYYIFQRNQPVDDKPPYQEYEADEHSRDRISDDNSLRTDGAQGSTGGPILGATTLGAATADYGKGDVLAEPGLVLEDDDDDDGASSSNAGSSGWSSSAGISSLNTGSMDDSADAAVAAGATLAGIGVASAFSRRTAKQQQSQDIVPPSDTDDGASDIHSVSRDQLDQLIEAGDWAAVGATAALLAAASDSQSAQSLQRSGASRSRGSQSADAARAAELDHLVDAGDWEGVVAAAAKFEAQVDSQTHSSRSRTDSGASAASASSASGTGSGTGTGTGSGTGTGTGTSIDSPSKMQKREEVRSEVEALVRRVVPEEIDNVDEMMNQFKGREEELVETLRTMQERAVAQKARQAGQKSAKMEARRNVQRGIVPGASGVVGKVASLEIKEAASGVGGGAAAGSGITKAGSPKSIEKARSALEQAIEEGDWDKVGEAASALQSDESASIAGGAQSQQRTGPNATKMSELDALIQRGNWSQVVNLANRFSGEEKGRKISKEEEDALKEAELWMKIAEQKKAAGATDAGASDAAEWAIQRSLSQLKEAEKKSEKKGSNEEDEV